MRIEWLSFIRRTGHTPSNGRNGNEPVTETQGETRGKVKSNIHPGATLIYVSQAKPGEKGRASEIINPPKGSPRYEWHELPVPGKMYGPRATERLVLDSLPLGGKLVRLLNLDLLQSTRGSLEDFSSEIKRYPVLKKLRRPVQYLTDKLSSLIDYKSGLINLRSYIEASGIKRRFMVDHTARRDERTNVQGLVFDRAVDLGAAAVCKLIGQLRKEGIDLRDVAALRVACSTANCNDPTVGENIKDRLIALGIVSHDEVKDWDTKGTEDSCTAWVSAIEDVTGNFNINSYPEKKYAVVVAVGVYTRHFKGKHPHHTVAYNDRAAAGVFKFQEDSNGRIILATTRKIFDPTKSKPKHEDREPEEPRLWKRAWNSIKNEFDLTSSHRASKNVATTIYKEAPKYLYEMLEDEKLDLLDFDFIVFSQTSRGVLEKEELGIAELLREKRFKLPKKVDLSLYNLVRENCENINTVQADKLPTINGVLFEAVEKGLTSEIENLLTADEKALLFNIDSVNKRIDEAKMSTDDKKKRKTHLATYYRELLGISEHIRPELVDFIVRNSEKMKSSYSGLPALSEVLLEVIKTKQADKICNNLDENTKPLFKYMEHVNKAMIRTYPKHGYPGVASIPAAIAEAVERGIIDLKKHKILIIAAGLGVTIKGLVTDGAYKPLEVVKTEAAPERELVPVSSNGGNGNGSKLKNAWSAIRDGAVSLAGTIRKAVKGK